MPRAPAAVVRQPPRSFLLDPNITDCAGGLGQHVIGTFIANTYAPNILFTTIGNAVGHSGYQLRLLSAISGDYHDDDIVDARDYVMWRKFNIHGARRCTDFGGTGSAKCTLVAQRYRADCSGADAVFAAFRFNRPLDARPAATSSSPSMPPPRRTAWLSLACERDSVGQRTASRHTCGSSSRTAASAPSCPSSNRSIRLRSSSFQKILPFINSFRRVATKYHCNTCTNVLVSSLPSCARSLTTENYLHACR